MTQRESSKSSSKLARSSGSETTARRQYAGSVASSRNFVASVGPSDLVVVERFAELLEHVSFKLDVLASGQERIATFLGIETSDGTGSPALPLEVHNDSVDVNTKASDMKLDVSPKPGCVRMHESVLGPNDTGVLKKADTHQTSSTSGSSAVFHEFVMCNGVRLHARSYVSDDNKTGDSFSTTTKDGMMRKPKISFFSQRRSEIDDTTERPRFGLPCLCACLEAIVKLAFPLEKYSTSVILFDLVACVMLLKDSIMVPYLVAYDLSPSKGVLGISFFSAIFWTLDMLLRFVVVVEADCIMITGFKQIAIHYLKGWFMADFVLLLLDWTYIVVETAIQGGNGSASVIKLVRLLKFSRMLRVVAVFQVRRIAAPLVHVKTLIMQKIRVPAMFVDFFWSLAKLVLFILWLNHLGACSFVYLESYKSLQDTGSSMETELLNMHQSNASSLAESTLAEAYQFAICFYWSLTMLLTGESFLTPMTTAECIFASAYVVFGVLFVTIIISSMSAMLMNMNEALREQRGKLKKLNKFLHQRNIEPNLRAVIHKQVLERLTVESELTEQEVEAISCLSVDLKDQLRYNVYEPVLSVQPLWRACDCVDSQMISSICRLAVAAEVYKPGEIVFEERQTVDESYTVVWGGMMYTTMLDVERGQEASNSVLGMSDVGKEPSWPGGTESYAIAALTTSAKNDSSKVETLSIGAGRSVCEMALWLEWQTAGFLEAVALSELITCSATGLNSVLRTISANAQEIMVGYAKAVLTFISSEHHVFLSDVTASTDYDAIITFMPQGSRVLMSLPSLKVLKRSFKMLSGGLNLWSSQKYELLESEVFAGKCNLGSDESGKLLRVVRLVVLNLRRPGGLICVQVGEVKDGVVTPVVRLPGRKLRMQDTLKNCTDQLLDKHFHSVKSAISMQNNTGHKTEVELKPSPQYGIPTKYIRLVVEADIDSQSGFGHRLKTRQCTWNGRSIECFACLNSEDRSVGIFAWLTHPQHEELVRSDEQGAVTNASWINTFDADELAELGNGPEKFMLL